MNVVRVGAARFVITLMMPSLPTINRRFVSPGGVRMLTGFVKIRLGKMLVDVYPTVGGLEGIWSDVFGTRCSGPAFTALAETISAAVQKMETRANNVRRGIKFE